MGTSKDFKIKNGLIVPGDDQLAITAGKTDARRAIKIQSSEWPEVRFFYGSTESTRIGVAHDDDENYYVGEKDFYVYSASNDRMSFIVSDDGNLYRGYSDGRYQVWDQGNDGPSSGLNADMVDDVHASSFLRSDADDTKTGKFNQTSGAFITSGATATNLNDVWTNEVTYTKNVGIQPFRYQSNATNIPTNSTGDNANWGLNIYSHSGSNDEAEAYGLQLSGRNTDEDALYLRRSSNGTFGSWRKVHHEGSLPEATLQKRTAISTTLTKGSYARVARVLGNDLGSIVRVSFSGTTTNVVVAVIADIIVNHNGDIHIMSQSGDYHAITIKVFSHDGGTDTLGDEDFDLYVKYNDESPVTAGGTLALETVVQGLGDETVIGNPTENDYAAYTVGTSHEHTTTDGGVNFTQSSGNADIATDGNIIVGDGSTDSRILIKKSDNNEADHIQFYNGTTRVGEIGVKDDTWLRINQETSKNIYTPRYMRADGGFFVDSTSKGINGSGNFIGGTIAGASDANVTNWDSAYNDKITSASFDTADGIITLNQQDGGTVTVDIDGRFLTSETSHTDVVVDGDFTSQGLMKRGATEGTYSIVTDNSSNWNTAYNDKINSASFGTGDGILTLTQQDSGTVTVDLDGRFETQANVATYINRSYISNEQATNLASGWYTVAANRGNRAIARFGIWDTDSSDHQSVVFYAAHKYGTDASNTLTILDNSHFSGSPFRYIRIKDAGTYDGAVLQVYIDDNNNNNNYVRVAILGDNFQDNGWVLKDWVPDATDPGTVSTTADSTGGANSSNYSSFTEKTKVDLDLIAQGGFATTGPIYAGGDTTQYRVLTTNDEGSGNGLNADTVDGIHASSFLRSNAADTSTGTYIFNRTSTTAALDIAGNAGANSYNYFLRAANDGGNKAVFFVNGSTRSADGGADAFTIRNDGGPFILGHSSYSTKLVGTGNLTYNDDTVLTAGNAVMLTGNQTISGTKTFSDAPQMSSGTAINFGDTGSTISSSQSSIMDISSGIINLDASHSIKATTDSLTIESDHNTTTSHFPTIMLNRNKASGGAGGADEKLGQILFTGDDSQGNTEQTYAFIKSSIKSATNGSEDGELTIGVASTGQTDGDTRLTFIGDNRRVNLYADTLYIENSDNSSTDSPLLTLYRNSASPASGDDTGAVVFRGMTSAAATGSYPYVELVSEIVSPTYDQESSNLRVVIASTGDRINAGTFSPTGLALVNDLTLDNKITFNGSNATSRSDSPTFEFTIMNQSSTVSVLRASANLELSAYGYRLYDHNASTYGDVHLGMDSSDDSYVRCNKILGANTTAYYMHLDTDAPQARLPHGIKLGRFGISPVIEPWTPGSGSVGSPTNYFYNGRFSRMWINEFVRLYDNDEVRFGSGESENDEGGDAQIGFDGTDMYMQIDSTVSNFKIRQSSTVKFTFERSSGDFTAAGNVTAYSDERLKSNIKTLDPSKALQMRGVEFIKDGRNGSGVIAQEIEKIAPELVVEGEGGYKSVAYGNLTGYLIETVKEQQKQINELKHLVQKLLEKV